MGGAERRGDVEHRGQRHLTDDEKREVSGMVANFTMMGVQAGVWNALILLIGFVSLVTFVLPNI